MSNLSSTTQSAGSRERQTDVVIAGAGLAARPVGVEHALVLPPVHSKN